MQQLDSMSFGPLHLTLIPVLLDTLIHLDQTRKPFLLHNFVFNSLISILIKDSSLAKLLARTTGIYFLWRKPVSPSMVEIFLQHVLFFEFSPMLYPRRHTISSISPIDDTFRIHARRVKTSQKWVWWYKNMEFHLYSTRTFWL